ncbi:MAG: tetratricopeptide repeat protein [Thermoanaerobaculia bacterium]
MEQNKKELEDLVWSFKRAHGKSGTPTPCGRVLVITGAGCSASAGIPTAKQIAQECVVDLWRSSGYPGSVAKLGETLEAQANAAMAKLARKSDLFRKLLAGQVAQELPWSKIYEYLFTEVYVSSPEQKRVIEGALRRGVGLNWAHACLGELMRRCYVHTVLTVNFDLLALEGAVRAGVIPAIADGFEALSRVNGTPTHPQLVYLHGTRHNYTLRNAADQVKAILEDREASCAVRELVRNSECILVVGYSAADSGLAVLLKELVCNYRPKLVWTAFESQPERLSAQAREICDSSRATRLLGVDADGLFRELLVQLNLGTPEWVKSPLNGLSYAADHLLYGEDKVVGSVVVALQKQIARYKYQPDPIGFGLNSAAHQRLAGRDRKAINDLKELRSRYPDSPEVLRALGDILIVVGKERDEPELLEEAVETLKNFLILVPRKTDKEAWAQAQTMLGRALFNLGGGREGLARLKEAVAAFREALKVHTKRLPLDWAQDQNDLGSTLRTLADWEEGTENLKRAVGVFREALKVYTHERWPDHWATTQTSLGEALTSLGDRREDRECLKEAVIVLREVLKVRTREGLSAAWAKTQHYLGDALRNLGNRENNRSLLEEAVKAYQAALEVRTRDRVPLYWARTQDKLGRALASLGNREEGTTCLKEAVEAYRLALQVRSRKGPTQDWADTQCNLGEALVALGKREKSTARLKKAIVKFRAVRDRKPTSTVYASRAQAGLMDAEAALRA